MRSVLPKPARTKVMVEVLMLRGWTKKRNAASISRVIAASMCSDEMITSPFIVEAELQA